MYQPFDSYSFKIFEILNETTLLIIGYCLIPIGMKYFGENTVQLKNDLGWFMVAVVSTAIAANWMNLLIVNIIMIKKIVQEKVRNCKNKKKQ